ncbi:MAG TPA: ThiF family adenylyltransferase [Bryobacteraceae bacterium]|nr:ThiF family adenylyltransferase [Bryobacteraceae bacterium]
MDPRQNDRYSRQQRFAGIGEHGQRRILASRAAIVGCGALGGVQAEALARAGIGFLRLIDRDYVELSNLQRQFLFDESDALSSMPKAVAAKRRLSEINPSIEIDAVIADLVPSNADDLLGGVDLILDGSDNFETRYLINDFAVNRRVPWIYGAAVGSYGLVMPVFPGDSACLRCVYPEPPAGAQPTCETAGVLSPVTLAVGALQVAAALKILSGHAAETSRAVTTLDVWTGEIRRAGPFERDPVCPACALKRFDYLEGRHRAPISLCGRNAVQVHDCFRPVNLAELAARLEPLAGVRWNEFALRANIDPYELTVFPDGRAIIKGTTDIGVARSIYARYVGN